jgi:hypothetical protein
MNVYELKTWYPKLYAQIYALGVRDERERLSGLQRKREAAELIVGSVESRNRAPVSFARVEGDNGAAYVIPTY